MYFIYDLCLRLQSVFLVVNCIDLLNKNRRVLCNPVGFYGVAPAGTIKLKAYPIPRIKIK